jgi:hypothetical protein
VKQLHSVVIAAAALLSACGGGGDEPAKPAGLIDQLEIVSSTDAYGGATPAGAAGPYTVITGIVHGKLNPDHPDNAGIVDLGNAPRDANGYVDYTTDVVILRPKSAANARRVLFYDVVNRGNKLAQASFVGGGALTAGAAPGAQFPSLLRQGYTVVWSGWQGDIAQTGNGASASVGTSFPIATNSDGSPITGLSREEYIPDYGGGNGTSFKLTYPPASLTDKSEVTFTARQTWLNGADKEDYNAPSTPVTTWDYVTNADGSVSVSFTPPAAVPTQGGGATVAPDAGTIYSFVYRAKNPVVMGIGFAAVRDLVSFLRNSSADAKGTANPLNDLKTAACAAGTGCAANPTTNFDVALGEGISQSGRFMRDFLYQGFNKDGAGRKVFDGMMPIISAGRRTWVNWRFAQGGRWSKQHEDHWMPGDQFPFAYNVIADPVGGTTDGLLKQCLASNTCPKIMQIDGAFEWWGGRASLVVTDGQAHDLTLPSNVRYYLVSGTQHGGGAGVTTGIVTQPAAGSTCQFAPSPVSETPVERALIPALENWVVANTAPPASQYPTVASGNLVPATQVALGFPDLSSVMVPSGASATPTALSLAGVGKTNQIFVTDYSAAVPVANLSSPYTVLVPKVDANGNETSGILMPELAVPLATYAGWNLRAAGHAIGDGCSSTGTAIPFAVSGATKAAGDPRSTLADLYSGRADYQAKFGAATDALVTQGYLTSLDGTNVYKAGAANISTALIPNP